MSARTLGRPSKFASGAVAFARVAVGEGIKVGVRTGDIDTYET